MPDDGQSLGGEQTFSGKVERDDSPQSLGDEGTYAGGPGVKEPQSLGQLVAVSQCRSSLIISPISS